MEAENRRAEVQEANRLFDYATTFEGRKRDNIIRQASERYEETVANIDEHYQKEVVTYVQSRKGKPIDADQLYRLKLNKKKKEEAACDAKMDAIKQAVAAFEATTQDAAAAREAALSTHCSARM